LVEVNTTGEAAGDVVVSGASPIPTATNISKLEEYEMSLSVLPEPEEIAISLDAVHVTPLVVDVRIVPDSPTAAKMD
jgi:hypothetical protein